MGRARRQRGSACGACAETIELGPMCSDGIRADAPEARPEPGRHMAGAPGQVIRGLPGHDVNGPNRYHRAAGRGSLIKTQSTNISTIVCVTADGFPDTSAHLKNRSTLALLVDRRRLIVLPAYCSLRLFDRAQGLR
jgi:hypothetical protein